MCDQIKELDERVCFVCFAALLMMEWISSEAAVLVKHNGYT